METLSPYIIPGRTELNLPLDIIKPEPLAKVIAETFGVPEQFLSVPFSKTRKREILNPRYTYINYLSRIKDHGPAKTSRHVGRSHGDIINACNRHECYNTTEKDYKEKVTRVLKLIDDGRVIVPEIG